MAEIDSVSKRALQQSRVADALNEIRTRYDLEWPHHNRLPDGSVNAHMFRLQGRLAGALRSRLEPHVRDIALELGALSLHLLLTSQE